MEDVGNCAQHLRTMIEVVRMVDFAVVAIGEMKQQNALTAAFIGEPPRLALQERASSRATNPTDADPNWARSTRRREPFEPAR